MIPSLLRGLRKNKFSFKGRVILLELKEIDFENYGKCVQLSNGVIDVVVTIDCGPRIVRFGFVARIGYQLLFIEFLRDFKRLFRREAVLGVGFFLERGQVWAF